MKTSVALSSLGRGIIRRLALFELRLRWGHRLRIGRKTSIATPHLIQIHGETGQVELGHGVSLDHGVILNVTGHLQVGNNTYISAYTVIGCEDNVSIGNGVAIGPHVVMVDTTKIYSDPSRPIIGQGNRSSKIRIADDCWIGAHCTILAGARIGTHSVVAAGSVVRGKFPPQVLLAGSPAKIVKHFEQKLEI